VLAIALRVGQSYTRFRFSRPFPKSDREARQASRQVWPSPGLPAGSPLRVFLYDEHRRRIGIVVSLTDHDQASTAERDHVPRRPIGDGATQHRRLRSLPHLVERCFVECAEDLFSGRKEALLG
jgi:hypothetical protein